MFLVEPEIEMLMRQSSRSLSDVALPDFVIEAATQRIAFEMERTFKRSDPRYIRKWMSYDSQTYSHVVYVCTSEWVLEYLAKLASQFPKIGFCMLTDPYKIYSRSLGLVQFDEFIKIAAFDEQFRVEELTLIILRALAKPGGLDEFKKFLLG